MSKLVTSKYVYGNHNSLEHHNNTQIHFSKSRNRPFFPHVDNPPLTILKKFRSTDDCSISDNTSCPVESNTASPIIQPAVSMVSLDVSRGRDILSSNYHVICETNKKDTVLNKKPETDEKSSGALITDF